MRNNTPAREFWLPDFCTGSFSLRLLFISFIAAFFVLVAQSRSLWPFPLVDLAVLFGLVVIILAASFGLICRLRQRLQAWRYLKVSIAVIAIIDLNVLWVSVAYHMGHQVFGWWLPEFLGSPIEAIFRHLLISSLLAGLFLRYLTLQAKLRERERMMMQSRLEALQARIQPHFLFNSMNIIASLISVEPEKAEQAVEDLATLFRASLRDIKDVPLQDELSLCRRYANIEELRLGDRFSLTWQVPEDIEDVYIPLLTLQPLLENAIRHGVEPSAQHTQVDFEVFISDEWVRIQITNDLPPVSAPSGNRMSMDNVRERIQARFGRRASLRAVIKEGRFITELSYPRNHRGWQ